MADEKKVLKVTGSYVLVTPLSRNGHTWKGRVRAVGTTSTIAFEYGDTVYYCDDDIVASIDVTSNPPCVTLDKNLSDSDLSMGVIRYEHLVTHYKVFAIEKIITFVDDVDENEFESEVVKESITFKGIDF